MLNCASIEHSDSGRGGAHRAIIARSLSSAQVTRFKSALGAWHSPKRYCAIFARSVLESLLRCLQGEAPTNASALLGRPAIAFVPDSFVRDGGADHGPRRFPLFLRVPPCIIISRKPEYFQAKNVPETRALCSALLFVAYLRVSPFD